ncbi:hypothetical protein DFH11DRAFT_1736502 [Phellopilus nigrolimitatus]|nr:hypothetical protein DFH11DRAFT_1736502 [Phellopilus nigrolimitatus]
MKETTSINAIGEVVVHGLAADASERKQVVHPEPRRPPSTLPPAANARLDISLSEKISDGRCGRTFRITVDSLTFSGGATAHHDCGLPPLCIKMAAPGMSRRLSKEAWCYEEMEKLQGMAIPHCYGWFESELAEGHQIVAIGAGIGVDSDSDSTSGKSNYEDSDDSEEHDGSKIGGQSNQEMQNAEKARLKSSNVISILLLEELGERLLDVREFPQPLRDDIHAVYEDICEMGIEHGDCRPQNILRAANCPPGFPSIKCPRHGCEHQWRIIDFHIGRKTNIIPSFLLDGYGSDLKHMIDELKITLP